MDNKRVGGLMLQFGLFFSLFWGGFSNAYSSPLAMLVSGGGNPAKNTCAFYDAINQAQSLFTGWDKRVAMSDGKTEGNPNAVLCDPQKRVLLDEHRRPQLGRVIPDSNPEAKLIPATFEGIKAELKKKIKDLKPDEPVLLFLDDHGYEGPPQSKLTLWWERMTVNQMRDLISLVPHKNKVILVSNFCYGGDFIEALKDKYGKMRSNACGFFTSQKDETVSNSDHWLAYTQKDKGMNFRDVFDAMSLRLRFSTPFSSEIAYLEKYLDKAKKKKRSYNCDHCAPTTKGAVMKLDTVINPATSQTEAMQSVLDEKIKLEKRVLATHALLPEFSMDKGLPSSEALRAAMKVHDKKIKELSKEHRRYEDLFSIAKGGFIYQMMGKETYNKYSKIEGEIDTAEKKLRKWTRDIKTHTKKLKALKGRKKQDDKSRNIIANPKLPKLIEPQKQITWEEVALMEKKIKQKKASIAKTKARLRKLREAFKPLDVEYWRWNYAAKLDNPEFVKFSQENYQNKEMQSRYSDEDKWENPDEKWTPEKLAQFSIIDDQFRDAKSKRRALQQLYRDVKSLEALQEIVNSKDERAAEGLYNLVQCGKTPLSWGASSQVKGVRN